MCCQHSLYFIIVIAGLLVVILFLIFRLRHYMVLSETDEMTSIPNYRSFDRRINKLIAVNKKKNTSFTIAILDIDGFKRFNDQSYEVGDSVLKDFVRFIKAELPAMTFIARFRFGDEFIVLLNATDAEVRELYKNIRNKIDIKNDPASISFSYGIAGFDNKKDTAESLLARAEKDLKGQKQITKSELT